MKSLKKPSKADLDKVLTRGVEDIIDPAHLRKALLSGRQLRIKHGIDPTGPKIHLGRAATLRKLRAFQDLGHQIVLIVGDFTALIGDPSDKLDKRPMLTPALVKENMKNYKKQLGKVIDMKKAELHYNSKWLKELNFKEIAELAESFTVQQMLARRNFSDRYKNKQEISLREFLYPLMQGYDSVAIKSDVEVGGFDQLFNLKAGRTVQKHYGQDEQDLITVEMLEGTDGRKMSTSWGNVITIMDEPNDMFGKLMSVRDELIPKYMLLCTDLSEKEIAKIEKDMKSNKLNPRDAKLMLAREIVTLYHGKSKADKAEKEFLKVFSKGQLPTNIQTKSLDKKTYSLVDLLTTAKLAKSKSEARRLIEQGGVRVDSTKQTDIDSKVKLSKTPTLIQVGKRKFLKIKTK